MKEKKPLRNNVLIGIVRNNLGIIGALLILIIVFSLASPYFLKVDNLSNVLQQISMLMVCSVGMTFVILAGGIDLSIGAILGMSGGIIAFLMTTVQMNFLLAILLGLLCGTLMGVINGLLITGFSIPPFIVTLATSQIIRGIVFMLTGGQSIYGFPDNFRMLGRSVFGFPVPVIIMILMIILGAFILYVTKLGRYIYAIGGNDHACYLSGLNVKKLKIFVYGFAGFCATVAAIIMSSRMNAAAPTAGQNYELNSIAAVVIGGTSMSGGEGKISGTIIGALIIGVINNGMNLLNISQGMQMVIIGVVMIAAVVMDTLRRRSVKVK